VFYVDITPPYGEEYMQEVLKFVKGSKQKAELRLFFGLFHPDNILRHCLWHIYNSDLKIPKLWEIEGRAHKKELKVI
jgi:hypothetical protein